MGVQPVWQAVEAGADIEALVVSPELLRDSPAARMVAAQEAAGTQVIRLTAELFTRLADRDAPAGLAAIVRSHLPGLEGLKVESDSLYVALYGVGNPGNLGTIVRTADAVGADGVILIGHTADPFDPIAVKASMGALFQVPLAHAAAADEFFHWAAERGIKVATTSARADTDLWRTPCPLPMAYLLGSEGDGLPRDVLARGDLRVRIPILGRADSLNLAVAAGILLYEARRQHSAAG